MNVHKKAVAALLIGSNAGLLFLLKFASSGSFFVTRLHLGRLAFLLPMGISFYTLQIIAYVVDVYRGKYPAEKNFLQYMLFVMYFPQILQGPIARFDQLKKQLCSGHTFSYATFVGGFELMIWGYFQKLVIADRAAVIVDRLFGEYRSYTGVYMLLAGVLYSIQLYTDFNGCVCIARGASEMLGITLAENFDHPYFATSIQDFWHRWHMSLSSWLRDYVYIPLGGNRKGKLRKYVNILLTFLVSGLWHGMGLTYLVWGFLHGLYQIMGSLLMPVRDRLVSLTKTDRSCFSHRLLKQLCTFSLSCWHGSFPCGFRDAGPTDDPADGCVQSLGALESVCVSARTGCEKCLDSVLCNCHFAACQYFADKDGYQRLAGKAGYRIPLCSGVSCAVCSSDLWHLRAGI